MFVFVKRILVYCSETSLSWHLLTVSKDAWENRFLEWGKQKSQTEIVRSKETHIMPHQQYWLGD